MLNFVKMTALHAQRWSCDICPFFLLIWCVHWLGFPCGPNGEEPTWQCRRYKMGSDPGLGRYSGERNSNPLQYSFLENSVDRVVRWITVQGITKSQWWLVWLSTHYTVYQILHHSYISLSLSFFLYSQVGLR